MFEARRVTPKKYTKWVHFVGVFERSFCTPEENACIFKFDVFGLYFDPSRFVLMDQINSAGDIADYEDFM